MKARKALAGSLLALSLGMTTACSGGSAPVGPAPQAVEPSKTKEPVELIISPYWLSMSDQEFEDLMFKPLKEKFPHITMKLDRTDPTKMQANGQFPDIFYTANSRLSLYFDLNIPYDMSQLAKKHNLDLNKFAKPNIDWVRELGPKGEIYGIPFDLNHMALFYNKDLFDKRGVPYPKEGITWDELYDLAKKLTYVENGVQYRGVLPQNPEFFTRVKSTPLIDAKTNKSLIDTPENKVILERIQRFFQIPGMIVNNEYPIKGADFIKDQTVAMYVNWLTDVSSTMQAGNVTMNFDITAAPMLTELPGLTIDPGAKLLGVSNTSQHKEEAFEVIQFLTTSPEVQSRINRRARLTALADETIRSQFGADMEVLKGKNVQAALKVKPAKMIPPNIHTITAAGGLNGVLKDLALGTKDINTLLREAQEAADKKIEQDMKAKK
ncbi:ABC transporter substrate-binding protein [Paenibacillus silviterrae]|uniref:ABC transporter substrate-binding protein n=1 Tax=Paenibacillus silviterrae TaxID=3242194 RepID=UPI0025437F1F|nr:extracellular solute-binding protein [Paenibacillus chinjuensis]